MNRKFPSVCFSVFASLCAILLAVPHTKVRANATLSVDQLIAAVNGKGKDDSMDASTAEALGLGRRTFPVKEIDITEGSDAREIAVGIIDNQTYLFLDHSHPNEAWIFRVSKGGVIDKAVYGLNHKLWHDLPKPQATSLVTDEEAFWSDWLANNANGAKLS